MAESSYSFSLTTFSPSGKLAQIEYALNAVAAGATSLGIKARGVRQGRRRVALSACRTCARERRRATKRPAAARRAQAKNGVVVATEKKMPSPLVDESTVAKARSRAAPRRAPFAGWRRRSAARRRSRAATANAQ